MVFFFIRFLLKSKKLSVISIYDKPYFYFSSYAQEEGGGGSSFMSNGS